VYRIVRRAHGVYVIPLFVMVFFTFLRTVVWIGMTLDHVFFPRLARTQVKSPIVLVGNPRTGTTFLQRFLSDEGFGKGMELFLMLYPSILLQKLLRPFLPLLEKVSPARFHSTEAHETSLSSVETDDASLLLRYFDGFLFYSFFLSFDEEDLTSEVDPEVRDTSDRDFAWLEKLWRRSLVVHDTDRNIAKLFTLVARLPQFLERFPEAKILYMARDPLAVIPSTMSLVTGVVDRAFGFWSKPDAEREQWLERMYQAMIMLLRRFHDHWVSGKIDHDRVFIVRYDEMMQDFEGIMERMCVFLDHEMTPELRAVVAARAEKQRGYKSEHRYDLAKFGLTEERIRQDCAFFYETFLTPPNE
jgi:hypothetical protein